MGSEAIKKARFALLFLLFSCLFVWAGGYDAQLKKAERSVASASKTVVWRGYHDYQSLYMKGLLESDKALQKRALEGLIKASKRLGLDATRYRNALKSVAPATRQRQAQRASRSRTLSRPVVRHTGKRARLVKSEITAHRLSLRFDRPLSKRDVHHFVLKEEGRWLYVYDLQPAALPYAIKRVKGDGFKEIRIGQFDPRRVRVVVETTHPYQPLWRLEGKRLEITLPGASLTVRHTHSKPQTSRSFRKHRPQKEARQSRRIRSKRGAAAVGAATGAYRPDKTYTVVIDPGHGGKDGGAVGYRGKREKDAVLALAKELKTILRKRGYRVYLTRERDRFIPLKRRTRFANRKHADLFISIHANAAPRRGDKIKNRGIETYFLSRARTNRAKRVAAIENSSDIKSMDRYSKEAYLSVLNREKIIESNKLAIDLQRQMLMSVRRAYNGVVDNGVREGPFWVLVGAQMPAVLIEVGYITNPTEALRLFSSKYRKLLAEGIANGVDSYVYHNLR